MNKIDQKIVGYKIAAKEEQTAPITETLATLSDKVIRELKRPLACNSKTYRLKPPTAEHALYVTISSIEQDGKKYPFELFFNTKNPNHIEWTSALTLTISIAFRTAIETGSSLSGLIENLKETFGTSGSYLSKVPAKPKFVNGLVAEIGLVIEEFNNECLAWNYSNSSHETKLTTEELEAACGFEPEKPSSLVYYDSPFHVTHDKETADKMCEEFDATIVTNPCPTCASQLVKLDGCDTCPACGYSKCG